MATRPDRAYTVGMLGRYNSAPNEAHMTAAKRVCRYLKGTTDIKLVYTETVCEAVGYSDADWASSVDDGHSTSGNVMLIAGGAVSWLSDALYPLGPVATLRFCHLRPRCVSKQRRTTNVIITDRVWWIWCDASLTAVATRPQRSPHSVASNSRPDYFAATRSRSLFLT